MMKTLKHFYFDIFFTIVCLIGAAYWGFTHGGTTAMLSALFITMVLALMEISLSFDNAVVNASVLKHWDKFWKTIFLTVGMLIAVFGMRLVFPIVIVAVTADMGMKEVVDLALNNPKEYSAKLMAHHAEISAFGGMFLLLVFLNFVFDDKDIHWFGWLEKRLAKFGKVDAMSVFVAIVTLMISLTWVDEAHKSVVLMAGVWGILIYMGVNVLSTLLEGDDDGTPDGHEVAGAIAKGGIAGFLYLEVLDASFSFDGVIGAFAITNDVVIIMIGLAIGAMFVRSMTIFLVEKGTLDEFVYLEHGAHYAIGALAIIMLISMKFHVPEIITGLIGVAFIVASVIASIRYRRNNPHKSISQQ
ncbi:integral membrane protein, YkoY family [Moraxella bovis]|uniref:Integral membrane protein, YkoY family n=2 Tax=Moraxella bovis TaxID=476 RepID=A0A378PRE8_MORBO|nr:integral membrane protein, YkoY family [Moraxella bovis]